MPRKTRTIVTITHENARPGQFFPASDNDGGLALCCPANGCAWEVELRPWQVECDLDALAELAKQHLEDTR